MNYDAPDERWPAALKTAFEKYVGGGGGLVVVHAADNAFAGWPAFNEMIGVGAWRGRTETAGPLWYFKDGKSWPIRRRGPPAATARGSPSRSRSAMPATPSRAACRRRGCTRATSSMRAFAAPART